MTVSTSYAPLSYAGNGATTAFAVTWPFFTGTLVVVLVASTGVETTKTITTHYTVSGGTDSDGLPATGTVTMVTAPAVGETLKIRRVTPKTQATEYDSFDSFPEATVEAALDKLTLISQEGALGGPDEDAGDVMSLVTSGATDYWDAESHIIRNVADALETSDAVNYGQLQDAIILAGAGDVVGPVSALANYFPSFDGTTGKLIKDSGKAVPSGDVVGTSDTQSLTNKTITAKSSAQWSSLNVGNNLILDGTRYNALGILDEASDNGYAVFNETGVLQIANMPTIGTTAIAPKVALAIAEIGDAGTNDPLAPPYQITPIDIRLGTAGAYDDSSSSTSNIFHLASWVTAGGTRPTVAIFGQGIATEALSKAWGGNFVGIADEVGATAHGIEIDFINLVAGGNALGLAINVAGSNSTSVGLQFTSLASGATMGTAIRFLKSNSQQPFTDALIDTSGSVSATAGIDLSAGTFTYPFKANAFHVDGSGNIQATAGFLPVVVGGSGVASTLKLRATSGVGAGSEAIIFETGNAGATEAGRITTSKLSLLGSIHGAASTAIPSGGTAGVGALLSSTANFGIFFGSGVPTLSAAKGSLYLRSDGSSTTTRAYINTDGSTTWTAITTGA